MTIIINIIIYKYVINSKKTDYSQLKMCNCFKHILQCILYLLVISLIYFHISFAKNMFSNIYDELHFNIKQQLSFENILVCLFRKYFNFCGEMCYKSLIAVLLSGYLVFNNTNLKLGII